MFAIDVDSRRKMMLLSTRGIWDLGIHARFVTTRIAQGSYWRVRDGTFAVLGDLREHPIQPAELDEPGAAMKRRVVAINPGPIALTVGSTLRSWRYCRVNRTIAPSLP